jgi:hypothetical protein
MTGQWWAALADWQLSKTTIESVRSFLYELKAGLPGGLRPPCGR